MLKETNSFGEQILSLKDKKTAIIKTHINNDIYNKYCLIHNSTKNKNHSYHNPINIVRSIKQKLPFSI